jgi:hypothetical protein
MRDKLKRGALLTIGIVFSTLATVAVAVLPANAALGNAYPTHDTRGPGLKNWHCVDPHSSWSGPWRYTKSGATIDCASYNTRADRP